VSPNSAVKELSKVEPALNEDSLAYAAALEKQIKNGDCNERPPKADAPEIEKKTF